MAKAPLIFTYYIAAPVEKVWDGFVSKEALYSSPPAGTLPPYASCSRVRSALAALKIAQPHEAVPDEPPATKALGRELSPISRCTRSGGISTR